MSAAWRPTYAGPRPAICGFLGDGEAWVERCADVPHAAAAVDCIVQLLEYTEQWVVIGTRWLSYGFEDRWEPAQRGDTDALEFWHLTWRKGANY